jgi:hypothetical protein
MDIIAATMGGTVTGPDSCNVPGPGHGKADRSLSVRINRAVPLGFTVYSFAGDDWRICRDFVAAALGFSGLNSGIHEFNHHWPMGGTSVPLRLWNETIAAPARSPKNISRPAIWRYPTDMRRCCGFIRLARSAKAHACLAWWPCAATSKRTRQRPSTARR